ncbi:MAG: response regulator [Campylobacterota bacterium]|nr:response regulator [Campylobacterota bacterium]
MKLDTKKLKTITLLYVEDDDTIRNQTFSLFEKIFKKVYVACDGQVGLDTYSKHQDNIDIIVSDIHMPKLNGLDMIEKVNNIEKVSIPKIITTAHTDSQNLLNAIDIHVDKYIRKPVQIKDLTVSIVNLVSKYRRSNKLESLAKGLVVKSNHDDKKTQELSYLLNIKTKENELFKNIIDNYVSKFRTDKNGIIMEVTPKLSRLFEYEDDELIGENINKLKCTSCSQESFQKLMLKAIHSKQTVTATHTFTTNSDKSIVCDVTMTPSYGSDSLVSGYTFYLDII